MTNFDEFWKINEPAFGESEKDYFLRLSAEFKQLRKAEARKLRKQRWADRLTAAARLLVIQPNLLALRTRSV